MLSGQGLKLLQCTPHSTTTNCGGNNLNIIVVLQSTGLRWCDALVMETNQGPCCDEPAKDAAPDGIVTTSKECEEAFNLYYSLEDFVTADTRKSSSSEALVSAPSDALASSAANVSKIDNMNCDFPSGNVFQNARGSLLDDPILDDTAPLLDQLSASKASRPSYSLLDEPMSPLTSTSLLPLPEYSGFRVQSHQITSIPCGAGPASLPCLTTLGSISSLPPATQDSGCNSRTFDSSLILLNSRNVINDSVAVLKSDLVTESSINWSSSDTIIPADDNKVPISVINTPVSVTNTPASDHISPILSSAAASIAATKFDRSSSSPTDAFSSPLHTASLPPPLQPVISSLPHASAVTSRGSVASPVGSQTSVTPAVASQVSVASVTSTPPTSSDVYVSPLSPPNQKKTALATVVDVLAEIADSIDQIL